MDVRPRLGVAVLVVEDHPDTRELLTMVLGQAGGLVKAVGSAREAFAAGFDAYVRKPSDPNDLVETIAGLTGS